MSLATKDTSSAGLHRRLTYFIGQEPKGEFQGISPSKGLWYMAYHGIQIGLGCSISRHQPGDACADDKVKALQTLFMVHQ